MSAPVTYEFNVSWKAFEPRRHVLEPEGRGMSAVTYTFDVPPSLWWAGNPKRYQTGYDGNFGRWLLDFRSAVAKPFVDWFAENGVGGRVKLPPALPMCADLYPWFRHPWWPRWAPQFRARWRTPLQLPDISVPMPVTITFPNDTALILFQLHWGEELSNARLVTDDAKGGPH